MLHSNRDLARKVAKALTSSTAPEFQDAQISVEKVLATNSRESPGQFDAVTAIAIANLIVALAKLTFDIWKHHSDAEAAKLEAMVRARAEELKEWRAANENVKQNILSSTLEVIKCESS